MNNTQNPFAGKTVVATGKLVNYTRDGIQMKLLSLGAHPASSVSKNRLPDCGRKSRQQAGESAAAGCENSDRTGI